jgi:hypothetical protein
MGAVERSPGEAAARYPAFPKIPRLHRDVVITEKIDGTNAQVWVIGPDEPSPTFPEELEIQVRMRVLPDGTSILAGSRTRWIHPKEDNHGFARWVWDNAEELAKLGPGHHYGEWWGGGINRGYGLQEKRFSLFNTSRWSDLASRPGCCDVVPILAEGNAAELTLHVHDALTALETFGSWAAPGYPKPEGIVVYHKAANQLFKVTIENDAEPKSLAEQLKARSGMEDERFAEAYARYEGNPIGLAKFVTSTGEPVLAAA